MTVFIDTSVIMYAAAGPHLHRDSCRGVLQQVADGRLAATTSTEVVQEILRRFARGDRQVGAQMASDTLDLFGRVLPIDHETIAGTVARFRRDAGLSARDAIHAATCVANRIDQIVSVDTDFDAVADLTRRVPDEFD